MSRLSNVQYIAIGLIILSVLMNLVYYMHTDNFNSPIIDYEFVKNQQEVKDIFLIDNEFKKNELKGVRDQNILDYLYMVFYSLLLILSLKKINQSENKKFYNIGIAFAFLALISDIFENIQMFRISELLVNRINFSSPVRYLFYFTRLKWLSLAFVFFLLSFHYYKYKFVGKVFSLLSAIPIMSVITYIIFNDKQNQFIHIFTNSVILAFVLLIIWLFISQKADKKINFYKTKPISNNEL